MPSKPRASEPPHGGARVVLAAATIRTAADVVVMGGRRIRVVGPRRTRETRAPRRVLGLRLTLA